MVVQRISHERCTRMYGWGRPWLGRWWVGGAEVQGELDSSLLHTFCTHLRLALLCMHYCLKIFVYSFASQRPHRKVAGA